MKIKSLNVHLNANTNLTAFKGRIIDSHAHVGKWGNADYSNSDLDIFIKSKLGNGDTIEKMIVSNLSCIEPDGILDELEGNRQMLEIASKNSKIAPLAVCQPNLTGGDASKIEKLLKENPNKFAGLKFHPKRMELAADNKAYEGYMALAQKYKLPCLFHSDMTFDRDWGNGNISRRCEYSRPEQIYTLAKKYKDVPVILGHMGGNDGNNTKAAVDLMVESIENNTAKLYADISWVNADTTEKPDLIEAIKRLKNTKKGDKTDRILFGTDAPIGRFGKHGENGLKPIESYQKVVTDVKNAIRKEFKEEADGLIEKIFYKNADDLFFAKKEVKTAYSKTKIASFCLAILAIGGAITAYFIKNRKQIQKHP